MDEIHRTVREVIVDGFHPLAGQGPGVLDGLLANFAEAGINRFVVLGGGPTIKNATGAILGAECGILWIIRMFGLLFRIQVVEVAVKFIKTVNRGKKFVRSPM